MVIIVDRPAARTALSDWNEQEAGGRDVVKTKQLFIPNVEKMMGHRKDPFCWSQQLLTMI